MLLNIAIMVFAAVFFATLAIYYLLQTRLSWQTRATKKRLDDLAGGVVDAQLGSLILRDKEKLSDIPLMNRLLQQASFAGHLKQLIKQAGAETNPGTVILSMLSLGGLAFLIVQFLTKSYLLALLALPLVGVIPYFYLARKRSKRVQDFEELLPEALDMVVNSLRSGFTFELAMKMVAQEIPDPVGFEFAVVFEEQNLGVPLGDALAGMRERVPSDDLDLLIVALMIHRRTGGNLAEVLEKTSSTIRDRFRLKREVRTKTAHGRFSGAVLVCLPMVMVGIILTLNPDYFMTLIHEKVGNYMLGTAVVMQVVGILIIKKIINIKI